MKGYTIDCGYMGYIPHRGYCLFATESDYIEYFLEVNTNECYF